MSNKTFKIGILFSLTGATAVTELGQCQAALLAIKHINEMGGVGGIPFEPIVEDIASDPFVTIEKAKKLIEDDHVCLLIGVYTSACRQALLPTLKYYDRLLIYPTIYEGNEQNDWVFYTGALPNQQLSYFLPWIIKNLGNSFYLVSSDYVYPRKINQYIRSQLDPSSTTIVGETYSPLGTKNFDPVLSKIECLKPAILFSTLVGNSAVSFYEQLGESGLTLPICSPITAETEIAEIKLANGLDIYSSFPYFQSVSTSANHTFVREFQAEFGTDVISSVMENTYNSLFLLANALQIAPDFTTVSIRKALKQSSFDAPQGYVRFDERTQHLWQHSRIGKLNDHKQFDIVWESKSSIQPVPFIAYPSDVSQLQRKQPVHSLTFSQPTSGERPWGQMATVMSHIANLYPYMFLLTNETGQIIDRKNTNLDLQSSGALDSLLKNENGIFHALKDLKLSWVKGKKHSDTSLKPFTTVGIPLLNQSGCLIGVLGVIAPDHQTEQLIEQLPIIETLASSLSIVLEEAQKQRLYDDLFELLYEKEKGGLIILKNNELLFSNRHALAIFQELPSVLPVLLEHLSANPQSHHLRKRFGQELLEINIEEKNDTKLVRLKRLIVNKTSHTSRQDQKITFETMIGVDDAFLRSINLAKIAANTDSNVLIIGESGTGKELFANAIHNDSSRKNQPFIPINCGAIPKDLMQSELFGYTEGAFTGAIKGGKKGLFEAADNGTLFLDEIGEMPLELQINLLRVLQEREVTRIGSHKRIPINVRIIAATNKNIMDEIAYNGSFRSDLYFRLNVFQIDLLPLRERRQDIPELAEHFLLKLNKENNTQKTFSKRTIDLFLKYHWPGNIRELSNVVERSYYLSRLDTEIAQQHVTSFIHANYTEPAPIEVVSSSLPSNQPLSNEKQLIIEWLDKTGANISKVARQLNMSRTTLYKKINFYEIKIKR
ncbi:transporter substrate-binding protein [Pullulanibacillus sp. KACC 23026]|uniref:transporter substrate-binding protein n=1 Tax=Pullulanibacillus sp. KACC 23026 TaxID=3028315 RepID=UPI0023B1774E|nr:transporter substrate-binding protein [Pullulanibacillus sp. KACC 23026]WEG14717.1 transporter substrate-binding protein [Pullulanibacillus sp. KACC 23026]